MPPKGKGGKGGGKGAPGGKSVVVEMEVETDKEKFICNLLKKLLPGVGTEELELGECFLMSLTAHALLTRLLQSAQHAAHRRVSSESQRM